MHHACVPCMCVHLTCPNPHSHDTTVTGRTLHRPRADPCANAFQPARLTSQVIGPPQATTRGRWRPAGRCGGRLGYRRIAAAAGRCMAAPAAADGRAASASMVRVRAERGPLAAARRASAPLAPPAGTVSLSEVHASAEQPNAAKPTCGKSKHVTLCLWSHTARALTTVTPAHRAPRCEEQDHDAGSRVRIIRRVYM